MVESGSAQAIWPLSAVRLAGSPEAGRPPLKSAQCRFESDWGTRKGQLGDVFGFLSSAVGPRLGATDLDNY